MDTKDRKGVQCLIKRTMTLLLVFFFISMSVQYIPGTVDAINDPGQPAVGQTAYVVGDWTVQGVKEYKDSIIDLRGNLSIEAGGMLTLKNMTLRMNSSTDGEFGIFVLDGGILKGNNGTVFTAVNGLNHYMFKVNESATLELDDASVFRCGVSNGNASDLGLYVLSNTTKINDTKMNNNGAGIIWMANTISLTNSEAKNNAGDGVYLFGVTAGLIENINVSSNGIYGMAVIFCQDILLKNISATANSLDGFASYRSNYTMERIWSHKNVRMGILSQSANVTIYNSTFTGHANMVDIYLTGHNQTSSTGSGSIDLYDTFFATYHLHDPIQSLNSTLSTNVSVNWLDDGTPIEGAKVQIFNNSQSSNGNESFMGYTDVKGHIDGIKVKVLEDSIMGYWNNGPETFRAQKDGYSVEMSSNISKPWHQVHLDIDRNAPELVIISPSQGAIFNTSDITVTGTATDHDGVGLVEASWDRTNWKSATGSDNWSVDLTLPDGEWEITVRAYDAFNALTQRTVNVSIDTVDPPIVITYPIYNHLTNRSNISISGTTEPDAIVTSGGLERTNDDGTFAFDVDLIEGVNTISVNAEDPAGNTNSTSVLVIRDSVGPVLNVTWPPPGFGTLSDSVEVSGRVQGATNISYSSNDYHFETNVVNGIFSHTVPLVEGSNDILITAWDPAMNKDTLVMSVIRDTTAPVLDVSWDGGSLTNSRHITIDITTETGANVTINGVQAENVDGRIRYIFELDDGVNTISVKSRDWLGNLNSTVLSVEGDFTSPVLSVDRPVEGDILDSRLVNIFGTAMDDMIVTFVEVSIDGGEWTNATGVETWYLRQELGTGPHALVVRAWDLAGNPSTKMVNFTVLEENKDIEDPKVQITWPREGSVVAKGDLRFTGTATDDTGIKMVEWSLDGVEWSPCEGIGYWSTTQDLGSGSHTIYFRATDIFGKTNITSLSFTTKTSKPRTEDDPLSGAGMLWTIGALVVAIVLMILYFVLMARGSKKAIDEEERMEREAIGEWNDKVISITEDGDDDASGEDE